MTSVFTVAPRTVLLSATTNRLKLEVPDAMSPAAQVVQRTVGMPQVQFINRGRYPDAVQNVQTTVELPQVQYLDKDVDIHSAGEARTNVKLLGADAPRRSTLISPIRQEDEDRTL